MILRGELDLDSTRKLLRRARAELARGKPIIIELAGLDSTDLNGVRALMSLAAEDGTGEPPGAVEIHGARGQVAELIYGPGLNPL